MPPFLRPAPLLRHVDGIAHVVLGPILLALASTVADLTGVRRTALVPFLVAFTAYGSLVLLGLRGDRVPRWLLATGIAANLLFLAAVGLSVALSDLTPLGFWLHAAGLASGIAMTGLLVLGRRHATL